MALRAAVGSSTAWDPRAAGHEAARGAVEGLGGVAPSLVLVFATVGYDQPTLIEAVREVTGDAPLSGCSGEGVITRAGSDESTHSVAVMALHSPTVQVSTFLQDRYSADAAACARDLARRVREQAGPDPKLLIIFPDGLTGNCAELLRTLDGELPDSIRVVGGAAGDMLMSLTQTFQYHDGTVASDSVAAVLLGGPIDIAMAVSHGCTAIGSPRQVTSESRGWVESIDGEPAWQVFREYLDGEPEVLTGEAVSHLCVGEPLGESEEDYDRYLIRVPLQLDADRDALFFPGGLQVGTTIQMARRDPARITSAARASAARLRTERTEAPAVVFQFDCAGRGRVLFGARINEQIIHPIHEELGPDLPWIGFHTYGEIAPLGERTYYHNYTVVLCALYG